MDEIEKARIRSAVELERLIADAGDLDLDEIAVAALQNGAAALRSARVPEPCEYPQPDPETGADRGACCAHAYADGWNDCRRKMLAAAPSAEGVE